MRIALFVTCVNETLFPATARSVVEVLERLGHQVIYPEPQTCCGHLHLNAGYRPEGLALARSFIDTFSSASGADVVVIPSASCTATVRELWVNAAGDVGDRALVAEAQAMAPRVYELTELLVDVLGVTDVGAVFPHRVAYHPTCHSLRVLRLGGKALQLLGAVKDLELVELDHSDSCCGFGGLFSVKNPETSVAMGMDKLDSIRRSGAEVLCAADNSCLTHLWGLASRRSDPFQVKHLAEILAAGPRPGPVPPRGSRRRPEWGRRG
jgi:L-lactate dehydrogenase complex protein LldE